MITLAEGIVSEGNPWYAGLEPSIFQQVDHIVRRFNSEQTPSGRRAEIGGERTAGGGVHYMYAERQLVVREDYLDHVRRILGLPIPERTYGTPDVRRVTRGVVELSMDQETDLGRRALPDIVEEIDGELGPGVATPNHVLTVAGETRPCPATEPQEVEAGIEPYPGVRWENGGEGVLIYIADTGLLKDAEKNHPWLRGVSCERNTHPWLRDVMNEEDELPARKRVDGQEIQEIQGYDGHGTFVAGVARCMAPQADIIVENVFDVAGSALETDFVRKLDAALRLGVDIFHLSVSAPTRNDVALVSLQGWMERLRDYKGVVCVVPAGNSGTRRPSWPGAFPEMISVGALATDLRTRADFSDYGGWVDVYAPGRDLINAYATGTYTCHVAPYENDERTFYGMARWSGTSFSSPIVTGLIASRMSRTGENAQQAAAVLLAEARAQAIPGVGPVLLP